LSFYPYHLLVFFFFYSYHPPRFLHSFPTRRSSDLSTASAARIFPLSACFTVAISSLPRHRIPPSCGGTLLFYSRVGGHASLPSLDTRFGDSRERSRAKKRRLPSSRRLIRAKRQCTAVAAHSSISLTADAPPRLRSRSKYDGARFFR